ncbi:photosystem II assembly protein Psb34 [Laspinema olomoucense]|uniref:Ssl1498 family light-harvesting-like protein n=1 Tax=Laspinema olomoucense D3b TaxID=2953688 RepID=A0ABT2N129_9CYAN|nr:MULTISPECIES: ssl1498 family light-harvesting-like protein [unclassified Laspinema]MCT7971914.1 ssl1498 family light-harvesting-like protein [Laspinema sp. D3d]MCT7976387.1 ssl1498 family light-harvesting-like protein [Laspinema sp. D3b]MCT7991848.1 ssl1498 family light-harvesting-like protein [Laspinema sp. D3a]MCT7994631.1 ssl1498 family light-harvesting-like protein [Laspinema sp. D3c]
MPYSEDEGGLLNNFAKEPKMYTATPPTTTEKRNYVVQAVLGLLLVSGLVVLAASISNLS